MKRFLLSIMALFTCLSANAESITSNDVRLTLVPAFLSTPIQTGIYNSLILKLNLPNGWYTYYKNGGDTGLGAEISFKNLPKHAYTTDIFYQVPTKHAESGIVSYIYKNEAYFAFNILQQDKTKNPIKSGPFNFKGKIDFLVCKDVCIPLAKTFEIKGFLSNSMSKNFAFMPLFKTLNIMDKKNPTNFTIKENNLYIELLGNIDEVENATFIPDEDVLINDMAKQSIVSANSKRFLKVELDEFLEESPKTISGIISTNKSQYSISAEYKDIEVLSAFDKVMKFALIALFALVGGIILNLMPCVLPVIGLKAYSMMKHDNKTKKLKGALSYCAGVFTSMMLIVLVLVILKQLGNNLAWGFQLQNHYFVGFMITLLVLVGLNLLGLFNIGDKLASKASKLNMKHSSDFFTGVLTTFVATPCTAPFMATSIGFALSSGSLITIFVIFGFLALGICLPIILISLIPNSYKLLPKPGRWTEKLKQFLAFPIFATAVWLVWVLLGTGLYTNIAIVIFALSFVAWLCTFKTKFKYIVILITALLTYFTVSYSKVEVKFVEFSKQEIDIYNLQNKTVFVDFTAKWCLTCQYNKKAVIQTEEIQDLFAVNNIVYMVADWTDKNDTITKQLQSLGRNGVPVYAFYKTDGTVEVLNEILTKEYLIQQINKLKENTVNEK